MPVSQQGAINANALIVPDLYVQIVPPSNTLINGVPTNILGAVGTAQWGPVNAPTAVGTMADFGRLFGALQNRLYDLGTFVAAAVLQGANNFRCVRVTDGTDTAATGTLTASSAADATAIAAAINSGQSGLRGPSQFVVASASTTTVTVTAKYTGSLGNALAVSIGAGSKAGTSRVTVALPGQSPEAFDNLGAAAATAATATMAGGTDGASTITSSVLLGVDTTPRKGMYALRNTGASIAALVDLSDVTSFTTQVAFGLSEGIYMVGVTPVGDSVATAVAAKATAGIDSYAFKCLLGDWVYWQDTVNGVTRLISPQGFFCGRLANLSPEQSSLNKQIYGIVGTQKSYQNLVYSSAELAQLGQAGIDVITNPSPGGNYFSARFGHNSSSNPVVQGDSYTRMTNYIAYTINASMGKYVGALQSRQKNDPTRLNAKASLDSFLENLRTPTSGTGYGMIDDYQVILDKSNNSDSRIALGYMQADCKVIYLGIVEKFLVNIEGGQSVTIARQSTALA